MLWGCICPRTVSPANRLILIYYFNFAQLGFGVASISKSFSFGRRGEDKGFTAAATGESSTGGVTEDVIFLNVGVMTFAVCFRSSSLELRGDSQYLLNCDTCQQIEVIQTYFNISFFLFLLICRACHVEGVLHQSKGYWNLRYCLTYDFDSNIEMFLYRVVVEFQDRYELWTKFSFLTTRPDADIYIYIQFVVLMDDLLVLFMPATSEGSECRFWDRNRRGAINPGAWVYQAWTWWNFSEARDQLRLRDFPTRYVELIWRMSWNEPLYCGFVGVNAPIFSFRFSYRNSRGFWVIDCDEHTELGSTLVSCSAQISRFSLVLDRFDFRIMTGQMVRR